MDFPIVWVVIRHTFGQRLPACTVFVVHLHGLQALGFSRARHHHLIGVHGHEFEGEKSQDSLPETGTLPSAGSFAECILSGTRQRRVCRVFFWHSAKMALPSVFFWHSAKIYFVECHFSALGKMHLCRVPFFWHSAKRHFAVCIFLPSTNHFFKAIFEVLNEFK